MPIMTTLSHPALGGIQYRQTVGFRGQPNLPMISAGVRFLLKPCLPVEQKLQSSEHPTCELTHRVPRLPSGM